MPGRPTGGRSPSRASTRDGDGEIYVMNADGSGQRRLTRDAGCEVSGLVAGRAKDRVRQRPRRHSGIYVMNADGSEQRRLMRAAVP